MSADTPDDEPTPQGATWAGEDGYDVDAEGNIASHMPHSDEQAEPDYNAASALSAPGDTPSEDSSASADSADAYDPAALALPVAAPKSSEPQAPKQLSKPPVKKRKTAGGFLVDDSDEEDDAVPVSLVANGVRAASALVLSSPAAAQDGIPAAAAAVAVTQSPATSQDKSPVSGDAPLPVTGAAAGILPHDTVGLLEARIRDDPRGAMDTWLALMAEHRQKNRLDDLRSVYARFVNLFPQSADIWVAYIDMELDLNEFVAAEGLFGQSLKDVLNVQLWTVYLDYIRRRNDLSDSSGQARQTVNQAYEFVLDNVGLDKDSGKIWQDYIHFIRYGPGTIGGSGWQDQQKMDQLRKAYQRAICVPISNVNTLWKEYDQFEMGLNKVTGRKFLAERSPSYMSAKSANTGLENMTRGLRRINLPRLPPVPGFDGDVEYMEQVDLWKKWIAWEKSDPLDIQTDEPALFKKRVLYVYKQALMALRFWPELWVDAAEWCFDNQVVEDGQDKGLDFLLRGITANPESILLALKHADRIELTFPVEEGDQAKITRGKAVRAPYDKILDTLYSLSKSLKEREKMDLAKIEEAFATADKTRAQLADNGYEDDDDARSGTADQDEAKTKARDEKMSLVRQGVSAQLDLLSKSLTFVWIALARAMRRIQGKGDPRAPVGGLRQIFHDARTRGRLGSEIYVAIAKMEWKCYNEKAGGKIFERGSKLFPEDPYFMIEYIKYMIAHNDITNSRVVFETCVNRLVQKPENVGKARPLLAYMHKREAEFGDLGRVVELEKRMALLYPSDPKLANFSARYSNEKFDPIAARIIVSPAAQLRPKLILPSIEGGGRPSTQRSPPPGQRQLPASPRPQPLHTTNSPKRAFALDDGEELNPPRKMLRGDRGESPLKGAAGRRLDQHRRRDQQHGGGPVSTSTGGPAAALPTAVTFLLGQIPAPAHYHNDRFVGPRLVRLLQDVDADVDSWKARGAGGKKAGGGARQAAASHGHGRQISSQYGHQRQSRDSPGPDGLSGLGRPNSPFGGPDSARGHTPSQTYRQSSLRPDSRDSYEPPPASYRQDLPAFPAPPPQFDNGLPAAWPPQIPMPVGGPPPPFGVLPPGFVPGAHQYQAPPPPPQPGGASYGGYRY